MQHPGVPNVSLGEATSETPDLVTRHIGVDAGAETLKVVELRREGGALRVVRREQAEHHKSPGRALREILEGWDWSGVTGAAVTGRLARQIALPRVPPNEALATGIRFRHGDAPLTVASIGSRGFSVLDLRADGSFTSRENSRCSQGTGNFLRQLVERFGLTVEEASAECVSVQDPAALSGRCPVLLKTDMTHLANQGEERARILAGLFDALCENLSVLVKPRASARVALVGGVARSERVRATLARLLARRGLRLLDETAADVLFYEALGCAVIASQRASIPPGLEELVLPLQPLALERVPALTEQLARVRRLPRPEPRPPEPGLRVVLGLDIGSTGAKAVALESSERRVVWESYLATGGNPVRATRTLVERFVESPAGVCAVQGLGVTGSGREITSSLLKTCYGVEAVYVLNEIAAHAEGARHYDAAVDTIFEIGGQDAKYIRLSAGRVVDAAMNEACSAGTGSFIEEQGRRCGVFGDVAELGAQALAASYGVSLGQHCSVFMAEIIDEAAAAGAETPAIVAGIYDAVIRQPDFLLLPLLRELPRSADEPFSGTCPIVQGSADVVAWDLGPRGRTSVVTAVIDIGKGNFRSAELQTSCRRLARQLGVAGRRWLEAYGAAVETQEQFERECHALGREALTFCWSHGIVPVVVLGRAYAIHNPVLSSGIPEILREQGALAIPADCYELDAATPGFPGIYWGDSQRLLRAAYQIRRTPGVYSLWCSHYSCGPDGFVLHFFSHLMEGKPFAIVENDGHTAAAGAKTRVEAFLHCVRRDLEAAGAAGLPQPLPSLGTDSVWLSEIRARGTKVLVPRMGHAAQAVAACLRGAGVDAECLPVADRAAMELGRRHTSGKECIPAIVTLGSLLKRLDELRAGDQRVAIFMPSARGPCRFGVYNILDRLVLERLGWAGRVEVWSPESRNYFHGVPPGLAARAYAGMRAMDLLEAALYDVRPVEARKGETDLVFRRHQHELLSLLETPAPELSLAGAAMEVWGGGLFGCADLLRRAAAELAGLKTTRDVPTVLLTGAVYARLDPFACDFIVDRLEAQGIRVLLASFGEWLEYIDLVNRDYRGQGGLRALLRHALRERVGAVAWSAIGPTLGWPAPATSREAVSAALPYLHEEFIGEAILAVGGGLREHHEGRIDAVVNVGPHECMPCKIAEAQFVHASEREALLSVSLPFNGDPLDPGIVENFAWEVHRRFEARRRNGGA